MSTSSCLKIILRVEVTVIEDDSVSPSQVQALATCLGAEQKNESVGITVEIVHCQETLLGAYRTIESLVGISCSIMSTTKNKCQE